MFHSYVSLLEGIGCYSQSWKISKQVDRAFGPIPSLPVEKKVPKSNRTYKIKPALGLSENWVPPQFTGCNHPHYTPKKNTSKYSNCIHSTIVLMVRSHYTTLTPILSPLNATGLRDWLWSPGLRTGSDDPMFGRQWKTCLGIHIGQCNQYMSIHLGEFEAFLSYSLIVQ